MATDGTTPEGACAVVVSGASKGIGQATALVLDAMGFNVFAGVRTETDGDALRERGSDRLVPVILDVTRQDTIARLAEMVSEVTWELLGLVNNAAVSTPAPLEFMPLAEVREQFEVNVVGTLALTQALLPALRAARSGRVVNVGSVNGRLALPYIGVYSASKFAIEGLSDALRRELRPWRIQVTVVRPGAIATPIFETSRRRGRSVARKLPDSALALYPRVISALRDKPGTPPERALPPTRVARVIARALSSHRPHTRYIVGWDARIGILLDAMLPDRMVDFMLTRRL